MQRVLSFQMARGFGESSEFVTKRMCFSFLFSVGFLCLLFGFLLGRFAAERTMEFRVEKKRLELAGNGLESTEYLQHLLLESLGRASFDADFNTNEKTFDLGENDVRRVSGILSNLSFIHHVSEYKSCVTAVVRGSREPDRYVILSATGDGIGVVLELVKIFNNIHDEHVWKPRRSIVFCIFFRPSDLCSEALPVFLRPKIIAYLTVDSHAFQGSGHFIVSGADSTQSIVLQAANTVQNLYAYNDYISSVNNWTYNDVTSRFTSDVPHAVLSFVNNHVKTNRTDYEMGLRKIVLAQILGQTVWNLLECLVVRWEPNYLNQSISRALAFTNVTDSWPIKEQIQEALVRLVTDVKALNRKIDVTESTNTLQIRMINDLLMDLNRALLCSNENQQSRTDWSILLQLSHEPSNVIVTHLNEIRKCYETGIKILHDWQ